MAGVDQHHGAAAETALPGGNMGGATRLGDSVRRPAGPWTPTVQRFLGHLREQGLDWVPSPQGTDEQGRDRVSYLPGVVPQYPMPDWVWHVDVLTRAGELMSQLHGACAGFDLAGARWRLPAHEPVDVVCHNDFAPYNMVFLEERLTGVIDWDTASPGPRRWDLAYLAHRLVPLADPAHELGPVTSVAERAQRLRLLCAAYDGPVGPREVLQAAVPRLQELAVVSELRAGPGHEHLRRHADLYRRDGRWIAAHTDALTRPGGAGRR